MVDDFKLADYFLEKCKLVMPRAIDGAVIHSCNERMRFLKYDHPGAKFEKHCDGRYPSKPTLMSCITL